MSLSYLTGAEAAKKFTGELDKMYVQKSVTGFLADNTFGAKFVGAKTVIMPDIDFVGLANYDRDNGFSTSQTTIGQTSFTLEKDRGRSLQIDRMDMDETGIANLAGKVLGEFVRTKVVPECDAYVLSKLCGVAHSAGNEKTYVAKSAYTDLVAGINAVHDKAGFDEELVAFVDNETWTQLMTSDNVSRLMTINDFKQGEINLKVKSLNGVAIIPVSSDRMKTVYDFSGDGFTVKEGESKDIRALILPKNGAHLVKKTEQMRIFSPEQNLDADAYKFDYRIFYDVFVKKSGLDKIYAIISE